MHGVTALVPESRSHRAYPRVMGNRIKALREDRGLTQEQVAEVAGTTKQQIFKLENDERRLTVDWLRRMAPAFNLHWAEMVDPNTIVARDLQEAELVRLFRRIDKGDRDSTIDWLRLTAERRDRDHHENAAAPKSPPGATQ